MNLVLHSMEIEGFRSIKNKLALDLSGAGLTYVTGENRVEPRLGANGVGKSTLFDGLFWVMFGKTSVNLRAGDIATWDQDEGIKGALRFQVDGAAHKLYRSWQPNVLKLDGTVVEQARLESILGYTPETFLYSVYHSQFNPHFADLSAADQLSVYSEVLRLNVWDEAVIECTNGAKTARDVLGHAREACASSRGLLLGARRMLEEVETKDSQWWRAKRQELLRLGRELRLAEKAKDRPKKKIGRHRLEELEKKADEIAKQVGANAQDERKAQVGLKQLRKDGEKVSGASTCPTCGQEIDAKQFARHVERESRKLLKEIEASQILAGFLKNKETAINTDLRAERRAVRGAELALERIETSTKELVRHAERRFQEARREECPHDILSAKDEVDKAEEAVQRSEKKIEFDDALVAGYNYWVDAFRQIKLALVKKSLTQFELTTNSALQALGLEDWQVEFDVEAETKGGKMRRAFTILVHSPHNAQPVPFLAWSGGEKQRLRLAVAFGFSDLIQDFTGQRCNVEIFDEPTAWLSDLGIEDLLEQLAVRASQRKTHILLADHRSLHAATTNRIVVVKDRKGTRLQ